jgi:DNA-binding response OmpR family regulator
MKTILVIEDEQNVRESILDLLESEGFHGIGGANGKAGMKLAQEYHPDLILCDVQMPEMNGFDVLSQLRQLPDTSSIPFIFLSAKGTKSDVRQGMDLGADDYLTKPCTATELLGAISGRLAKYEAMMERYRRTTTEPTPEPAEPAVTPATVTHDGLLNHFYQELRNPLSSINMALHLLKQDAPEPGVVTTVQREYGRELTISQEVFKLQEFLMPESAELLRSCNLIDVFDVDVP